MARASARAPTAALGSLLLHAGAIGLLTVAGLAGGRTQPGPAPSIVELALVPNAPVLVAPTSGVVRPPEPPTERSVRTFVRPSKAPAKPPTPAKALEVQKPASAGAATPPGPAEASPPPEEPRSLPPAGVAPSAAPAVSSDVTVPAGTSTGAGTGPRSSPMRGPGGLGLGLGGTAAAGHASGAGDPQGGFVPVAEAFISEFPVERYREPTEYPEDARRLQIEGAVLLRLDIDERGNVVAAKLLKGLGHGLDEAALRSIRKYQFFPARGRDGRPVPVQIRWKYTFKLPN